MRLRQVKEYGGLNTTAPVGEAIGAGCLSRRDACRCGSLFGDGEMTCISQAHVGWHDGGVRGVSGPLEGLRVIDLSSVVVGPVCSGVLAEQGATVIKIEGPQGDLLRHLGGAARNKGMSAKFLNFNRGRQSLCLDLKKPEAREALLRLIEGADIVVTNMRPEAQRRLGVDAQALCERVPRLIHCSIVGFGSGGPYEGRPAYDTVIQGSSGMAGCFEASTGEPRFIPMVIADHICGLIAAQIIGFALYRRERTGRGEAIEAPMFENMAAFVLQQHMGALTYDPPIGEPGDARILSPDSRPIPTADGYVCVSANTDAQAHGFFDAIGRPELKSDPRFSTLSARVAHTADYFAVRMSALKDKPSAHWLAVFDAHDVPAMPYNTIESLLTDPHVQAVGLLARETHPSEGETFAIRSPNKMSGGMAPLGRPASRLGEDGRQALRDFGFDAEEIECLIRAGALVTPTK